MGNLYRSDEIQVVAAVADWEGAAGELSLACTAQRDDSAYVLYTGSTGTPGRE